MSGPQIIPQAIRDIRMFGATVGHWLALRDTWDGDLETKDQALINLMYEVGKLRAKVSYYESRIQDMNRFMQSNIEIKEMK